MSTAALELDDELDEQEDDPIAARWREKQQASQSAEVVPHTEYRNDPVGWARDKLGIPEHTLRWSLLPEYRGHKWDGTPDPISAALEALATGKCVVMESGTGTGKTFALAVGQFWFQACWENSLVRSHAPAQHQLEDHMWKEIADLFPRFNRHFPAAERSFLRVRMRPDSDKWGAKGVVAGVKAVENETGSATKAQGAHAEHMLSIIEETPGMPPPIMTAIRQTSVSSHNLIWAVGNPDHQFDELHKLVTLPRFVHIRVSALDHPNVVCDNESVIPGAVTRMRVEEARATDGEGSVMFDSRVRGISPKQSAEALIRYEWLEAAAERYEKVFGKQSSTGRVGHDAKAMAAVEKASAAKGVDVAQSKNGDKASVATMRGEYLVDLRSFQCPNATILGQEVAGECRREGVALQNVAVDGVGVGAATLNALHDLDPSVFNFCGGPIKHSQRGDASSEWLADSNMFVSLRDQGWWTLREDIRMGRWHAPRHEALWKQLVLPKYERLRGGIRVETKEDIKKRTGGSSPDEADSVVIANFVRPREIRVVAQVVPVDPNRDPELQATEFQQRFSEELQYAAPDEIGAFSQFPW